MLIDWFTVVAQVVNLFILVYLLNRFLFRPLLEKVDQRKQQMQAEQEAANEQAEKALAAQNRYEKLCSQLADEQAATLQQTRQQAEAEKNQLLQVARHEVADRKKLWMEEVEQWQQSHTAELKSRLETIAFAMAKQLLKEFADCDLQEKIMARFLERLEKNGAAMNSLPSSLVTIYSAFELSAQWKEKVKERINKLYGGCDLHYAVDSSLADGGVMLESGSYQLSWSPSHYLDELQLSLDQE